MELDKSAGVRDGGVEARSSGLMSVRADDVKEGHPGAHSFSGEQLLECRNWGLLGLIATNHGLLIWAESEHLVSHD